MRAGKVLLPAFFVCAFTIQSYAYALQSSSTCAIDAAINYQQVRLRDAGIWAEILEAKWQKNGEEWSHHFLVWEHPRTGTLWVSDQYGSTDTHLYRHQVTYYPGLAFLGLMARGEVIRTEIKAKFLGTKRPTE